MTIRQKLTLYWAAVLAAILVGAALAVFVMFSREQWGALDAALMEEADTSAATIARLDPESGASVVLRLSRERDLGPHKRVRLIAGGTVLADFGDTQGLLPSIDGAPRPGVFDGGNGYRFALMPLTVGQRPALLQDGVDARPVRDSIARLRAILLLLTPFLLLVSVAGGYWLAGRSLAPINALVQDLAAIDPKDLGRRLPLNGARDEVARLARSINALLDRLETASRSERRFLSDAAHELRTPLAVLRTGLEVELNRERRPDELRQALQSALREVAALCGTADELLAIARLGEETYLRRAAVNLNELAREVAETVEPLIEARHLSLEVSGAQGLTVSGNRDHLRRLLLNLLDNAIKFTPEQGRVALVLEKQGGRALLHISDSGPGIAQDELPLVFDRFFRGAAHQTPGSGLGLSLCQEIVRLHNGEIQARNRAEGGCELSVALPLRED
jgi:signal transduction histidine kinase